jgi:hypothetical protein
MIIYSFIPILSVYAGWRIQKFWVLLGINIVVGLGVSVVAGAAEFASNNPYIGVALSLAIQVPLSVFIVRHFARGYNEKIAASAPPS